MGTWGEGNFQNDAALDFVGKTVNSLRDRIEEIFAKDQANPDERGEGELVPAVAVISTLCEHCGGAPPKPKQIESWRDRYLPAFDRVMPDLDRRGDFYKPRREVVVRTFDVLLASSRAFWRDDAG